jgi:hypothetical protein
MTTVRHRPAPVAIHVPSIAGLARAALAWLRHTMRGLLSLPADTTPLRLGRPVAHEGATEKFGTELRALRSIEVSPELVSDIETELRWGLIWHDFERSMQAEIDRVFAPFLEIAQPRTFDDLRKLIGIRELTAA